MEAYVVPGWLTVIAGLVIHRDKEVLLGLRSARVEAGKWCLPTGLGAIRRDTSKALAAGAPDSLENPMEYIKGMSERHQQAFLSPAGFALAEAKWYVQIPAEVSVEQLRPLEPICQLDNQNLLVKLYFSLEWPYKETPEPAKTEWPFTEVGFFPQNRLRHLSVAFDCDKDLDKVFW